MKREASDEEAFSDHWSSRGKTASNEHNASVLHMYMTRGNHGASGVMRVSQDYYNLFFTTVLIRKLPEARQAAS